LDLEELVQPLVWTKTGTKSILRSPLSPFEFSFMNWFGAQLACMMLTKISLIKRLGLKYSLTNESDA